MSKFPELSSLIWGVADNVLRGLFNPHEYGDNLEVKLGIL